jgi:hypothetical protein
MVIKLKVGEKFTIKSRGDVYQINLAENNLPSLRAEIRETLLGREVEINQSVYTVIGIEMYAIPEQNEHSDIGVMVKSVKPKYNFEVELTETQITELRKMFNPRNY